LTVTSKNPERAVLVGLYSEKLPENERSTDETLDELEALLETAGGECVGRVLQNRASPDPRTYIGEGKAAEIRLLAENESADLVIFDSELSPGQGKALEDELGVRVIDRAQLILDIFASRAATREGSLQVELAQYKYLLPRLTRMWTHLGRQAGTSAPIGTRGPGETQLETDRRHIRRYITKLEEEIEEVRRNRAAARNLRQSNHVPVLALVGYTNSGKSTLLNLLTGAGIPARDRLFDTLDTTTRKVRLSDTSEALLSDTVGFIRKLPHHLVDAFRATLEELKFADVILHVVDASSPSWREKYAITEQLIEELGCVSTPRVDIFNKMDLCTDDILPRNDHTVEMSALTGTGADDLKKAVCDILESSSIHTVLCFPYSETGLVGELYAQKAVISVQYQENAIFAEVSLKKEIAGRYAPYIKGDAARACADE